MGLLKFFLQKGGVFFLMVCALSCATPDRASLSPLQFVAALNNTPGQLIDVRTPREWKKDAIEGALQLDLDDGASFKLAINRLNRRKVYYVYCYTGSRAARARELMRQAGFAQVYYLRGGLASLKQEGYSVAGL